MIVILTLLSALVLSSGPSRVVSGASLPIVQALNGIEEEDNTLNPINDNRYRPRSYVKIVDPPPTLAKHVAGTRLELNCVASGSPVPTIQWLRDNVPIKESDDFESNVLTEMSLSSFGELHSSLIVSGLSPLEKVTYTCVAQAGAKTAFATTTVHNVKGSAPQLSPNNIAEYIKLNHELASAPMKPRIVGAYSSLLVLDSTTVVLPCKAEGNPRPEVYWLDTDGNVADTVDGRRKTLPSGDMLVSGLHWQDMGIYKCIARNSLGEDSFTTFLYPLKPEY